jgi:uncharacterized protein (UPF0335 family)
VNIEGPAGGKREMPELKDLCLKEVDKCWGIFNDKQAKYGQSWALYHITSLEDHVVIKAKRILNLLTMTDQQKVPDSIESEFRGIFNYTMMILMKMAILPHDYNPEEYNEYEIKQCYIKVVEQCLETIEDKNHDYKDAWRDLNLITFADEALVRIYRIRKIRSNDESNNEDIIPNYIDIANYAILALLKMAK